MLFWDWDTKHFESSRQMSFFEELEDAAVSGGDEIQSFDALPAHVFHSLQLGWSLSPRDVSMFQAIWWWYEPNHGVNHGECCVLPFKHLDALGSWQLTSKGKRPAFWGMPCCGWFLFLECNDVRCRQADCQCDESNVHCYMAYIGVRTVSYKIKIYAPELWNRSPTKRCRM